MRCQKCYRTAVYGYNSPIMCINHKLNDMTPNAFTKCKHCDKVARYGITLAEFCKDHAPKECKKIVFITQCILCNREAKFKHASKRFYSHCITHRLPDMVSKTACFHQNCENFASYHDPVNPDKYYCKVHKTVIMQYRSNKCAIITCSLRGMYKICGDSKLYCSFHKTTDMFHITFRKFCATCGNSLNGVRRKNCLNCIPKKIM